MELDFNIPDFTPSVPEPKAKKPRAKKKKEESDVPEVAALLEPVADIEPAADAGLNSTIKKRKPRAKKAEEKLDLVPDEELAKQHEEKQKLLLTLQRYDESRFHDYIKKAGIKFTKLDEKTNGELIELVNRVRYLVNNKGSDVSESAIRYAFEFAEKGITKGSKGKFDLNGLTLALWQDEGFLEDLERFRLEYLNFLKMDYRIRLLTTIATTAIRVNLINKQMNAALAGQAAAPAEVEAKVEAKAETKAEPKAVAKPNIEPKTAAKAPAKAPATRKAPIKRAAPAVLEPPSFSSESEADDI